MTSRNYCFTSYQDIQVPPEDSFRYLVYQKEKCPKTGKLHYQGYIEFSTAVRMQRVKRLFMDNTMHLEKRKGSREQARLYCMKQDTRVEAPVEVGKWEAGGSGKRNDLLDMVARVRADPQNLHKIALEFPAAYCRNRQGLRDIQFFALKAQATQAFREIKTLVIWGEGGLGKTRWAFENYPSNIRLTQPDTQAWWDEYCGEKTLILDDFYGWLKWGQFLTLLDGYPIRIPTKGGHTWANWTHVIITSNVHPDNWYQGKTLATHKEFSRRITDVVNMTSGVNGGPPIFLADKGTMWPTVIHDLPQPNEQEIAEQQEILQMLEEATTLELISSDDESAATDFTEDDPDDVAAVIASMRQLPQQQDDDENPCNSPSHLEYGFHLIQPTYGGSEDEPDTDDDEQYFRNQDYIQRMKDQAFAQRYPYAGWFMDTDCSEDNNDVEEEPEEVLSDCGAASSGYIDLTD